jgi:hypothetical protein
VVEEAAAAPGVADVAEEAPAEASAEAPAEAPAEVPAEAPAEAPAEVPADAPAEVPAEGEIAAEAGATAEAGEPSAETDVVTEEAAANNPHFGREFKLEAVMMVKDVTKYPDHYSTFETIKLRGTVLAIAGDKVLLGHETTDGFYMVCVNMGDFARRELKVGQVMQFEGKLTKQEWNIEDFGALDTGDKEQGLAKGFALVVEAGESE